MATALPPKLYTEAEFLALPDDGKRRWLIHGELREEEMTVRNRFHSITMARIAAALGSWRERIRAQGEVVCGEAGFRIDENLKSIVGLDVAFVSQTVLNDGNEGSTLISGAPILAVEILSPSTKQNDIREKTLALLNAGTSAVWIVDPLDQTIIVHRSNRAPKMFNIEDTLVGDDYLRDFAVPLRELFPAVG